MLITVNFNISHYDPLLICFFKITFIKQLNSGLLGKIWFFKESDQNKNLSMMIISQTFKDLISTIIKIKNKLSNF